ncbi:MAG: DNA mismatch repair protein MutS [Raineya sp.]|jgi:DNA mismatch repair protein MutS|nr:DNA mismatch repair protein MutS [Raineya sp.]
MKEKETPLMKQYNLFKKKYPGALLLFRVGDFYETFGEDAVKASKILGIVLTKRNNGGTGETELAGFPHHALDTYLPKLVKAGERVAICDQLEDPKLAKGLVKRGVTELVTPGVSFNDTVLEVKRNNYLCAITPYKDVFGLAFLDISTGEFMVSQGSKEYADKLLQSLQPSEILFPKPQKLLFRELFGEDFNTFFVDDWVFQTDFAENKIKEHFKTQSTKGFGVEHLPIGVISAGVILYYLTETEHHQVSHISQLTRLEEERYVWLDKFTIRNLELLFPQQEKGVPLVDILDQTQTPMGGRLLRRWIALPLKEISKIEERLDLVDTFVANTEPLEVIREILGTIGDLERMVSKIASKRIGPKELVLFKKALAQVEPIKKELVNMLSNLPPKTQSILQKFVQNLQDSQIVVDKIHITLKDDAPLTSNQGKMIQRGINKELDELHELLNSGKEYLEKITEREIERTGINSLKIQFNKVFGYYLEVSNANKHKVPNDWTRKQTLTNAERYITEELKVYEEKILTAEEKIFGIEQILFQELVDFCATQITIAQQNAKVLAGLDVLVSFAKISHKFNYTRPEINDSDVLNIKAGRHPVIEQQLPIGESYIPNDVFLDTESQQIIIITGPNMAGKSALLRQTALIVLMAQIGCFVPAEKANIGIVDKIFTRVGASDNIAKGESTFMVEMTETASIMNNLSGRSLVLMDEIGRGTSTYDGISIAWSILEFLHNHPKAKAKTLFATHYHELNQLENDLTRVKNYNVSVQEENNKIIFLRKLQKGGSEHSFGIHVAQMAGMPSAIVQRANEVLSHLEKEKIHEELGEKVKEMPKNTQTVGQLTLFEPYNPEFEKLKKQLKQIDVNTLTPIEALMKLNELKKIIS